MVLIKITIFLIGEVPGHRVTCMEFNNLISCEAVVRTYPLVGNPVTMIIFPISCSNPPRSAPIYSNLNIIIMEKC